MTWREGLRRNGEDETVVVPRERMIMAKGRTERGAREGSVAGGGRMASGKSASVLVRRSEEWMGRRVGGVTMGGALLGAMVLWAGALMLKQRL